MGLIKYDSGNLGEAIAGSVLSILFNGEVQKETLRGESNGALDLQLKYPTLTGTKTTKQVGIQVKTGKSYARWNKTNSHWTLQNINPEHIKKWQDNNQPVLIVWVNPMKKPEIYWKFISSKTSKEVLHLGKTHRLKPEALFEIDRLVSLAYKKKGGVPKINLKNFDKVSDARIWAKKELSRIKGMHVSEFGNFEISNYAMRHLTRASKNKTHIKDSLKLLPYVKSFLERTPHQIQTIATLDEKGEFENYDFSVIKRKVLFIYRNVKFNDLGFAVVYIRFKETVIYSKDWEKNFLLNKQTQHSLILESIYRKTE